MEPQVLTGTQTTSKAAKPKGRLLTDCVAVRLQLVEDAANPGRVVVRGEFARAGAATENKRVYPGTLWEREIKRLDRSMHERKLFGELDHPNDGRTMLARVSHLVTGMRLEDGIVIGEAEIVDTDKGKNLKALLKAGARVGVSSRGYGSTRTNESGQEVVQEDYQLVTFDFVAEPADSHAYPEIVSESKEQGMATKEEREAAEAAGAERMAQIIDAERKKATEETSVTLREEFAQMLTAKIQELRAEVTEQVRAEMLADPAVAGAKTVIDVLKGQLRPYLLPEDAEGVVKAKDQELAKVRRESADKDLKISKLEEENAKLGALAKEAGYKYFLERAVSGNPDADLVRKLIGDMKKFGTAAELKLKVESVLSDLSAKAKAAEKLEEDKKKEIDRSVKVEKQTKAQMDQVTEALEKSLALNKELAIRLYAEKRLANHPKAATIRPVLESAAPRSEGEVDSILERFRAPVRQPEELDGVRSRVRRLTGGGQGPTALDEETPSRPAAGGDDYNGLGVPLTELREMSGIRQPQPALQQGSGRR
jgi:hypothetical protein